MSPPGVRGHRVGAGPRAASPAPTPTPTPTPTPARALALAGLVGVWMLGAGAPEDAPEPGLTISEVLYAVPDGEGEDGRPAGDASGDARRDATGDEFIEIVNLSDRDVRLRGWTLTDRNAPGRGQFKFVFPGGELAPGAVAVVFNGHQTRVAGPHGDPSRPPPEPSPAFGGALVFTARTSGGNVGLANAGDAVLLRDPDGRPVQLVWWGKVEKRAPADRQDEAPTVRGVSVALDEPGGGFVGHDALSGLPFSPGRFPHAPGAPERGEDAPDAGAGGSGDAGPDR